MGEERAKLLETLSEGAIVNGVVKNITEYVAFVDLGGIDGLLHITDMAWRRVRHPSEVVTVGQELTAKVLKFDAEKNRVSLGLKQMGDDPWFGVSRRYPSGTRLFGKVTNIADYGAFVELEPGVEGLIHVSEMSWTKKNTHPGKIVSTSQAVDVQVLEVDSTKRRISLGLKQTQDNPWDAFLAQNPRGTLVEGPVRNITEFGLFIGLDSGVDGMVHLSDLDWKRAGEEVIKDYKKGDIVKAKVLDVDPSKERISLGIKQVAGDPIDTLGKFKKGDTVTCEITAVEENGLQVTIVDTDLTSYIKRSELARERGDQRTERYAIGNKVDAAVLSVDKATRRIQVSIKQLEMAEEKAAVAQFGSSDSGASLGDIFKAAIKKREAVDDDNG
jgi:small subunit ribosomal protein S1